MHERRRVRVSEGNTHWETHTGREKIEVHNDAGEIGEQSHQRTFVTKLFRMKNCAVDTFYSYQLLCQIWPTALVSSALKTDLLQWAHLFEFCGVEYKGTKRRNRERERERKRGRREMVREWERDRGREEWKTDREGERNENKGKDRERWREKETPRERKWLNKRSVIERKRDWG